MMAKERGRQQNSFQPRFLKSRDRRLFEKTKRRPGCFSKIVDLARPLALLDEHQINLQLKQLATIEQQMITVREVLQLRSSDIEYRVKFVQGLLTCLKRHHGIVYQGVLYGSTVNGLGHRDSDIDLRLRPLTRVDSNSNTYEPLYLNEGLIDLTLRNIAYQTTICHPAMGVFVPSTRCPLTKLKFVRSPDDRNNEEGLNFDITMLAVNSLGSFNSRYLRFLCKLEPKFHILALVLRHWSKTQGLIVPGRLSSYALINMLIFFCQSISPPLLPTVDEMRDMYFKHDVCNNNIYSNNHIKQNGTTEQMDISHPHDNRALTQVESQCLICLHQECYTKSKNEEPTSLLLLKFLEFYLRFPYSTHIITARPGHAITREDYQSSTLYNPRFPLKQYLNIQDPFDMKHNLTAGMDADHFHRLIMTVKCSYEVLHQELLDELNQTRSNGKSGSKRPARLAGQVESSSIKAMNDGFKKIKYALYNSEEKLTREDALELMNILKPQTNNREFKQFYTLVESSKETQLPLEQKFFKNLMKNTLKEVKKRFRAVEIANENKYMWGIARLFIPMIPDKLRLPKQEPPEVPTSPKN